MLDALGSWLYRLPGQILRPLERVWYEHISTLDRDANMIFMNYGWADPNVDAASLPLQPEDEANRYCIQLYHRVASAIDLDGLDVLEVGSGRGGGASYVKRYLAPKTLTGVDLTANAIAFCREHYAVPGLTFVRGDAQALEFEDGSFDAVINVESSHCYASMDRFLAEVVRVLRPGGHLLYADHRSSADVATLRQQFHDAVLLVVAEERLNAGILRALELDNPRKQALIRTHVPWVLRPIFFQFAAMEGTRSIYATLLSGERTYLRFVLRKECVSLT
ncbi:MAG: class I SAM-dependent methyltransferase [Anaerolineae bacterium]|jgi:ubiquinone/menaquinone biosynthesis C-methylase UbiE